MSAPVAPRRVALLVGAFFLSLYVLTMSGHFTSPDEEVMYQVTRSMAELRGFGLDGAGASGFQTVPGADGKLYGPYGVVPSALGVPAYLVGRGVAAALPARYSEVVPRFFFAMDDAVVSAITCVLVYAFAYRLGYGNHVAILVSLGFGLGTLAWPYSRYAWSEPVTALFLLLAVWAAYEAVQAASWRWSLLGGVALGLAIGSKITTALAVPVLAGYLLLAGPPARSGPVGPRVRWSAGLLRVSAFLAPLAAAALLIGLFDLVRFGSITNTGYNPESVKAALRVWPPVGVAGLLASPGKSLFAYSPLAVLGVIGWVVLAGRRPALALVLALVVVGQLLAVGVLSIWSGDLAWGPRYLVPVTALLVLPAGAALCWTDRRRRVLFGWLFAGLVAAGVVVNLGAVLLDQRANFDALLRAGVPPSGIERARFWEPATSPIAVQWRLIATRYADAVRHPAQALWLEAGTAAAPAPNDSGALLPRWTAGSTRFSLPVADDPLVFRFRYSDYRTPELPPAPIGLELDGRPVPDDRLVRRQDDRYTWTVTAYLDGLPRAPGRASIELDTTTWVPARVKPGNPDRRALGIQLEDARAWANGQFLPLAESPTPPMPVSDAQPWGFVVEGWFYVPTTHLADVWLWYLSLSGLPPVVLLLGLVPAAGLGVSTYLLLDSAVGVRHGTRRRPNATQ